jgi:hypothetical protein
MEKYEPIKGGPPGYSGRKWERDEQSEMTRFLKQVLPVLLADPAPQKKTRKPKTSKPTVKFIPYC